MRPPPLPVPPLVDATPDCRGRPRRFRSPRRNGTPESRSANRRMRPGPVSLILKAGPSYTKTKLPRFVTGSFVLDRKPFFSISDAATGDDFKEFLFISANAIHVCRNYSAQVRGFPFPVLIRGTGHKDFQVPLRLECAQFPAPPSQVPLPDWVFAFQDDFLRFCSIGITGPGFCIPELVAFAIKQINGTAAHPKRKCGIFLIR
mgnify:CR=1 FL=1